MVVATLRILPSISSFVPGSKGSTLGLSIDVKFVSKFFWKGVENLKRVKRGQIYMENLVHFHEDQLCNYLHELFLATPANQSMIA